MTGDIVSSTSLNASVSDSSAFSLQAGKPAFSSSTGQTLPVSSMTTHSTPQSSRIS